MILDAGYWILDEIRNYLIFFNLSKKAVQQTDNIPEQYKWEYLYPR